MWRMDVAELRAKMEEARRALDETAPGHPKRATRLAALANALRRWHEFTGETKALSEAIACYRESLGLTPRGHSDRPKRLNNCGIALLHWYELTGVQGALADAIASHREALDLTLPDHSRRPGRLENLGIALRLRYELTGERQALEEAIACYRDALGLTPQANGADRADLLNNLGVALRHRFVLSGERKALEDAIACYRDSLGLIPKENDADRAGRLSNLAIGLRQWYRLTGERQALTDAIRHLREALGLTPHGHARRAARLENLGLALETWYELTGDRKALEDAIACFREALGLTPPGHSDRPGRLSNLAIALRHWHRLTGEPEALAEAIACFREALGLTPPGHSNRPGRLNNLGVSLRHWHKVTGERQTLDDAVAVAREALALTPDGHSRRPARLSNLGRILQTLYDVTGERHLLDDAIAASHAAVSAGAALVQGGEPPTMLRHLRARLSRLLMRRDEGTDWQDAERQLTLALDQQEAELGRQEGERAALDYLRRKEDTYRLAVRCRLVLAERSEREGSAERARDLRERAWQAAEQGKGRLFAALLGAERTALAPDAAVEALLTRIESLRSELARLEKEVEGPDTREAALAQRSREWRAASDAHRQALLDLEAVDPELASLTAARPRTLSEVQAAIPEGAVLVELYPLSDRLALFSVDRDGLRVADAPISWSALERWTRELDQVVQDGERSAGAEALLEDQIARLGRRLEPALEMLLGDHPAKGASDDVPELLLVPTGPLHRWPLHVLPWRGGVLWDAFAVSYLPTADTLVYCAGRRPLATQAPLILAPDPGLPGTFVEAALAAADGWRAALRGDATLGRLQEEWGAIALATHVAPDPEGAASRLRLWAGDGPAWVSALEVLRQMRGHPTAEHGQIGACSAHYEETREGDHLQGLTRAFLAAGLRSLTSTLWPVDDLAASYLGARFRQLAAESPQRSKALLLRQAALELRDGGWSAAGGWLEAQNRFVGDPGACALLLAAAAVMRLRGGEPQEFVRLWVDTYLLPQADDTAYGEALRRLERYDALRLLPQEALLRWEEPVTLLHFAAAVLIGHPLPCAA